MGAALVPILEGGAAAEVGAGAAVAGEASAASRVGSFAAGQGDANKTPEGAPKKGREDLNNWFPGAGSH